MNIHETREKTIQAYKSYTGWTQLSTPITDWFENFHVKVLKLMLIVSFYC